MNPDNYGSLPACKKLAEVLAKRGRVIEADSAYYHVYHPADNTHEWVLCLREGRIGASLLYDEEVPAYLMAEVWRELPEETRLYKAENTHALISEGKVSPRFMRENPTDALIELWIWALKQEEASHD